MLSLSLFLIGAFIIMSITKDDDDDLGPGMMVPTYQRSR